LIYALFYGVKGGLGVVCSLRFTLSSCVSIRGHVEIPFVWGWMTVHTFAAWRWSGSE